MSEGPVLAGDTPMLPDSSILALPPARFPGGLPPLPFPLGQSSARPFLPPSLGADTGTDPPTPIRRAPADFVLQAFGSDRSGPMGPEEFALLQAALRQKQEGDRHK